MKVIKSIVEKIQITGAAPNISSINVFFEDHEKERGKVTIESDGDAYSYFWSRTGMESIKAFFSKAGTDYLAGKFATLIEDTIIDDSEESLQLAAKKFILTERQNSYIDKNDARMRWNHMLELDDSGANNNSERLYYIFGDEWYHDMPLIPNPRYEHLCKIINAIKDALALE